MYRVYVVFAVFLLNINEAISQTSLFFTKLSVEAGWGINLPLRLEKNFFYSSDYLGFNSFYLGSSFTVNKFWSARVTYAYNQLDDSGYSNLGIRKYKFMVEPTMNFLRVLNPAKVDNNKKFEIKVHGGAGFTLAQSMYLGKSDDAIFTLQLGVMPCLQVIDKLFLIIDCVSVFDIAQKYDTHGLHSQSNFGAYLVSNIGLSYSFSR